MAVTSLWPIKGRVDRVINYARNPEKTSEDSYEELASLHAVDDVVEYAANDMKTERRSYVSCLNCEEDTAAHQFIETKKLWQGISGRDKMGGRVCFHGYQSFKADEVTAETAHEIGVKLAQELWGDRFEVVVATHCNTGHFHNHFVLNSVSFADGLKFDNTPADYARMREVSDRLCREYAISVIENPGGRAKNYGEWQAEQNGKPTNRGTIRADIDRAIRASTTERDFIRVMSETGYTFKTRGKGGKPLKYPGLKPPDAKGYFRFHKLGEGYTLEEVKERILQNVRKQVPFPEVEHRPPRRYRMRGQPRKKVTGLRALYFRYCYELHIIVKRPASVKRVSFLLREDIAKLDRLDAETRFLGKRHIGTIGELTAHREKASAEIDTLTAQRLELRKEVRRLMRQGDTIAADEVKGKISAISSRLKVLRKEVVLCDGIAQRSGQVKENLERLIEQKETERKELTQMSYSGDAAEQVVRLSLETGEVAVKLAGEGAKQLAILLYAILREQKKTKGKTRLTNMLRSGKELKVFAVKDTDLQLFCREAKKYGVLYCVLKDKDATDGITDIMVRAEDASKINRIFERFDLATVDMAEIKSEIERSRAEQQGGTPEVPAAAEPMTEQETEELLDAMLSPAPVQEGDLPASERIVPEQGGDEFWAAVLGASPTKEEGQTQNPTEGRVAKSRQSEPTSKPKEATAQGPFEQDGRSRSSVRQELNDIKAEQREKAADKAKEKPTRQKSAQHKAPPKKNRKKGKER